MEVKLKNDGGDIDAITGATITSKAVISGMLEAGEKCGCGKVDGITKATTKSKEYNTSTTKTNETMNNSDEEIIPQNKTETITSINITI